MGCCASGHTEHPGAFAAKAVNPIHKDRMKVPLLASGDWVPPADDDDYSNRVVSAGVVRDGADVGAAAKETLRRLSLLGLIAEVDASRAATDATGNGHTGTSFERRARRRSSRRSPGPDVVSPTVDRMGAWKCAGSLFALARQVSQSESGADFGAKLLASFQRVLEVPVIGPIDQKARVSDVQRLQSLFCDAIRPIVVTIVKELTVADADRAIPRLPLPHDPSARVYVHRGVVFRVITGDTPFNHTAATKVAGREVASVDGLLQCCLPNLQFPLSVAVDFIGFRVIATPILPLSDRTLLCACKLPEPAQAGSGVVVIHDDRLDSLFGMVAARLNLRKHLVSSNPAAPPVWLGVHVEGHLGSDGRRYLINPGFVFPPIADERLYVPTWLVSLAGDHQQPVFCEIPPKYEAVSPPTPLREVIASQLASMSSQSPSNPDVLSFRGAFATVYCIGSLQQSGFGEVAMNTLATDAAGCTVRGPAVLVPDADQLTVGFHLRMRPELVSVSPGPLSSDGLSHVNVLEDDDANRDLSVVTQMLFTRQIEEAANALDDAADDVDIDEDCEYFGQQNGSTEPESALKIDTESSDDLGSLISLPGEERIAVILKSRLHGNGVNLRYMGLVRRSCTSEVAKQCLLMEMTARTLADRIHASLHKLAVDANTTTSDEFTSVTDSARKAAVLSAASVLVGASSGLDFRLFLWNKYPGCVSSRDDSDEFPGRDWLWLHGLTSSARRWVLLRACELSGVQLSPKTLLVLTTSGATITAPSLTPSDIAGFVPVAKTPSVTYTAETDLYNEDIMTIDAVSGPGDRRPSVVSSRTSPQPLDGPTTPADPLPTTSMHEDPIMFQRAVNALKDELAVRQGVLLATDDRVIQVTRDLATIYMMRPSTMAVAEPLLHQIHELRPFDVSVTMDLAEVYVATGKLTDASKLISVCESTLKSSDANATSIPVLTQNGESPQVTDMRSVRALAKVAHLHAKCGSNDKAASLLFGCVASARALVGPDSPELAVLQYQLGSVLLRLQQFEPAIAQLQSCCDVLARTSATPLPTSALPSPISSHTDKQRTMSRAFSVSSKRSYQSALASPIAANTTRDSFHRQATYASALLSLGTAFRGVGQMDRAVASLEEALKVQGDTGGKYSSVYVIALRTLAAVYFSKGAFNQADVLLRECCQLCPVVTGQSSIEFAASLQLHADVLLKLGQVDKAIVSLQTCANIRRDVLGDQHPDYVSTLQQLSALYVSSRRHTKAIETLMQERQTRLRLSKSGGGWNADLAANTRSLVALYKSTKQFDKACELLETTLQDVRSTHADSLLLTASVADDVAGMMKDLAELYKLMGRKDDVVALLSQACSVVRNCAELGDHHPKLLSLQSALGWAYAATGEFEQCIAALNACAQAKEVVDGSVSTSYADALVNLGRACKIAGEASRAVATLDRACKVYEACGQSETSQALEAKESYVDALIAAGQTDSVVVLKAECDALRSMLVSSGSITPRASFSVQPRRASGVSVK